MPVFLLGYALCSTALVLHDTIHIPPSHLFLVESIGRPAAVIVNTYGFRHRLYISFLSGTLVTVVSGGAWWLFMTGCASLLPSIVLRGIRRISGPRAFMVALAIAGIVLFLLESSRGKAALFFLGILSLFCAVSLVAGGLASVTRGVRSFVLLVVVTSMLISFLSVAIHGGSSGLLREAYTLRDFFMRFAMPIASLYYKASVPLDFHINGQQSALTSSFHGGFRPPFDNSYWRQINSFRLMSGLILTRLMIFPCAAHLFALFSALIMRRLMSSGQRLPENDARASGPAKQYLYWFLAVEVFLIVAALEYSLSSYVTASASLNRPVLFDPAAFDNQSGVSETEQTLILRTLATRNFIPSKEMQIFLLDYVVEGRNAAARMWALDIVKPCLDSEARNILLPALANLEYPLRHKTVYLLLQAGLISTPSKTIATDSASE